VSDREPHPLLLATGAAVLLVTIAYLSPPVFQGTDWLQMHLPFRAYAVEALRAGRLPLWNPYTGLGRPFLADTETAVLYPPNLLYLLLDPSSALFLLTIAHYVLGLLGMLALGHALGVDRWAAWLVAACFLWSAPLVARLSAGQVPMAQGMCYVPLLLFLTLRLQDGRSARRLGALAAALALQLLCGHPQIAWITWLGLGAFALGRSTSARSAIVGLGGLAVAIAAALALAAPMLLPFFELVTQGNRAAPTLAFAAGGSLEGWQWTSLALPDGGRRVFYWESNLYGGLLPVVAGLAGLASFVRDRNVRGLLLAGALGALLAVGPRTPLFAALFEVTPGLAGFHLHSRAALLVLLTLLLGSGVFLSRFVALRRAVVFLGLGAALAVLGPIAFRLSAPAPDAAHEPFPTARLALGLGAALLAGLAAPGGPARTRTAARVALAGLVLVELGASIAPLRRVWQLPVAHAGERPLFEALRTRGLYPPSGVPPRVAVPPWSIRQDAGVLYKWSSVAGYNSLTLDRVWVFLHRTLGIEPPLDENTYPSKQIYEHGPFPYDSMSIVVGWKDERPVLRREPDPRAYLTPTVRRVADWREAVALIAAGHDFHRSALVETGVDLPAAGSDVGGPEEAGSARIVSFEPERLRIATTSSAPALLVVAEPWYPGWSATVDGKAVACRPANAWMRAALVPAGTHLVEMRFRSRWLGKGALVSLGAALALALAAFRGRPHG
jgi:hypothetical protein